MWLRPTFARARVRYVPQMEIAECGAACLTMVARFHGHAMRLLEARQACGVSRDGVSALAIVHAARARGFEARGLRADAADLAALPLPAVLHWEGNHFVVLERLTRLGAVIVDPAAGRRSISFEELKKSFAGVALAIEPGPHLELGKFQEQGMREHANALRTRFSSVGFVLLATLLLELLAVLTPASSQVLVDHVIQPQRDRWLVPVLVVTGTAVAFRTGLKLVRDHALYSLHFAVDVHAFVRFVDHLAALPISFFHQRTPGDLMARVFANQTLREALTRIAFASLSLALLVVYGLLMLTYDVRLACVVLCSHVLRALLTSLAQARAEQAAALELTRRGQERSAAAEILGAPEMMKAFGIEEFLHQRFVERATARLNTGTTVQRGRAFALELGRLLEAFMFAVVLWFGGQAVLSERITLGVFVGFLVLQTLLKEPIDNLLAAHQEFVYARGIFSRMDDIFSTPRASTGHLRLSEVNGSIELRNVSFAYPGTTDLVLDHVNLRLSAGEKVAIVGRSGQGKSTIANLLLALEVPSEGAVLLDGHDLRTLHREAYLEHVGVVGQDPFLLDDSLYENVVFGRDALSQKDVDWALSLACLTELARELGDVSLGENGSRLSGGQRQRVALARALVTRPRVLVLDEATSALDLETEAHVHANLSALACTRVVIAHRLATVRDADRIVVLEGGKIVQQGRYEELLGAPGPFASLVVGMG